jgi:hypothetical protein
MSQPPLKPLHADDALIKSKLDDYGKLADPALIDSLRVPRDPLPGPP